MFGINGWEFVVLVVVALAVLGPERLPAYAAQLARMVRQVRDLAAGAGEQMRKELGPEYDDIDWRKLDPRQYDPRRIVREALSDSFDLDDPLGLKGSLDPGMKPRSTGGPQEAAAAQQGPGGGPVLQPEFDDDLGWPREPEISDDVPDDVRSPSARPPAAPAHPDGVLLDPDAT